MTLLPCQEPATAIRSFLTQEGKRRAVCLLMSIPSLGPTVGRELVPHTRPSETPLEPSQLPRTSQGRGVCVECTPVRCIFLPLCPPPPTNIPSLSPCSWVVHISSLASPFPTLFLPSPCLASTYNLCFLFPAPFPPFSPLLLPADNPPCDLHFCGSVPVLVVGLVCCCFCFRCGC